MDYCEKCYIKNNTLDFTKTEMVIGSEKGQGLSVLFVHGAGGCRTMFEIHAKRLAQKGFRCVLLDLPGHGARMNEKLTLQTAIETILQVTKEYCADYNGIKPVYVGGSLGGYIGMELLGQHPQLFSGAVIGMSGQDVGEQRGFAAAAGLFAMEKVVPLMSAKLTLNGMISQAIKNGHISKQVIYDMAGGVGMFFHQALAHVEILKATNPRKSLPAFSGKLLFVNGSKDHRDSENAWLAASKHGKLVVIDGGDHFFSHDDRYFGTFMKEMETFLASLVA
jgi:pimeloyl-ACP methyl ester carboxylesterase